MKVCAICSEFAATSLYYEGTQHVLRTPFAIEVKTLHLSQTQLRDVADVQKIFCRYC